VNNHPLTQSEILMSALPALRRSALIGKSDPASFLLLIQYWTTPPDKRQAWMVESRIRQIVLDALSFAENTDERCALDLILDRGVRDFDPMEVIRPWAERRYRSTN
jgi:hypothetical protein